MARSLLGLLATTLTSYGAAELRYQTRLVTYRLRSLAVAMSLLAISVGVGLIGITGVVGSLFFHLSDLSQFTAPSLMVGVITLLVAGLLGLEGLRHLKN